MPENTTIVRELLASFVFVICNLGAILLYVKNGTLTSEKSAAPAVRKRAIWSLVLQIFGTVFIRDIITAKLGILEVIQSSFVYEIIASTVIILIDMTIVAVIAGYLIKRRQEAMSK